ncbi:unnamed protein product [Cyprideis torosa]|uniref:Uncharacterized protein n=1 Tax=Cyprideis torosa TaxID=163714 RepID=A0A7R8WG51_9CRUS|nr:unnamed protein product [Cyprideis torosa]CAG0897771.1 unnamed protein product [Cyprideis torosa]
MAAANLRDKLKDYFVGDGAVIQDRIGMGQDHVKTKTSPPLRQKRLCIMAASGAAPRAAHMLLPLAQSPGDPRCVLFRLTRTTSLVTPSGPTGDTWEPFSSVASASSCLIFARGGRNSRILFTLSGRPRLGPTLP